MLNRIIQRLDENILVTQTAYRKGRSTSENVFVFKILAEKAIIEENAEINLRLLDMSKAFGSVKRMHLMNDLNEILEEDELHIIKILLNHVSLMVKNNKIVENIFETSTGIPQGDCLSPIYSRSILQNL